MPTAPSLLGVISASRCPIARLLADSVWALLKDIAHRLGLDLNLPLRYSGISWLGEIPMPWEV